MPKQEINEEKNTAAKTDADAAIEQSILAFLAQLDGEDAAQADTEKSMAAQQQRIWSLELEICRLRMDMETWKKASLCLAHELRELLIYQPATAGQPGPGVHAGHEDRAKFATAHQYPTDWSTHRTVSTSTQRSSR